MKLMQCPFCDKVLKPRTVENEVCFVCDDCGLVVSAIKNEAHFIDSAPKHLKESFAFLDACYVSKPDMVFSKNELWDKEFSMKETLFMCTKRSNPIIPDFTMSDMHRNLMDEGYQLIAGIGMYSFDIIPKVILLLRKNVESNDIVDVDYLKPEVELWTQVIFHNNDLRPTLQEMRLLNAYFAPTFEGMLYWSEGLWRDEVSLPELTAQQMLYSYLLCQPQVIIGFGGGMNESIARIRRYVRYILRDVDDPIELVNLDDTVIKEKFGDNLCDSLMKAYVNSVPSLAVNYKEDYPYTTFDILELKCYNNVVPEETTSEEGILVLSSMYKILWDLFEHYAGYIRKLGIEFKESKVGKHDTPNETVLEFWRYVKKGL